MLGGARSVSEIISLLLRDVKLAVVVIEGY